MYQVSDSGFNFNDTFNHNLYPNHHPIGDYSMNLALRNSDYFSSNPAPYSPNTLKGLLDIEESIIMESNRHEPKYISPNSSHHNPLHSNIFPSDNSCSYDSLVDSDDSLSQSYNIGDHADHNRNKSRGFNRMKNAAATCEILTKEEEEKRKLRRERNKLAAARCRKRRLDHTNSLVEQTKNLEEKKHLLEVELLSLEQQKNDLEHCLRSHESECKSFAIKHTPYNLPLL